MGAKEALSRINELSAKRDHLLTELGVSLDVQAVWPDAFKDGQRCRLRAQETAYTWERARQSMTNSRIPRPGIHTAFLERDDGTTFPLTSDQFYQLAREFRAL